MDKQSIATAVVDVAEPLPPQEKPMVQWNPPRLSEGEQMIAMVQRVLYDPTVSMDRMELLMKHYDRYKSEQQRIAYVTALSRLQPRLPIIDATGTIKMYHKEDREKATRLGIAVESMEGARIIMQTPYATLADIVAMISGPMGQEGFALDFPDMPGDAAQGADTKLKVSARLSHIAGHVEVVSLVMQHDTSGAKNPIQAIGSTFQYGMRLGTRRLLNIQSKAAQDSQEPQHVEIAKVVGSDTISDEQYAQMLALMDKIGMGVSSMLTWAKIPFDPPPDVPEASLLRTLPADKFSKAMAILDQKAQRLAEGKAK